MQAYPPSHHYSNPVVYHGIRRVWTLGVSATGGFCGSSPQGDRKRNMYLTVMIAVPFLYPEIDSIRDFNTYACSTVALGKARDRLGLWRVGQELNLQPPVVLRVCLPISTSHPYCRHKGGDIIPKRLGIWRFHPLPVVSPCRNTPVPSKQSRDPGEAP